MTSLQTKVKGVWSPLKLHTSGRAACHVLFRKRSGLIMSTPSGNVIRSSPLRLIKGGSGGPKLYHLMKCEPNDVTLLKLRTLDFTLENVRKLHV